MDKRRVARHRKSSVPLVVPGLEPATSIMLRKKHMHIGIVCVLYGERQYRTME